MLKVERIKQRYSRRQLAELVGCSPSTIVAIEQRGNNPSLDLAFRLAGVLAKPIDQLFCCPKATKNVTDK